MVDPLLALSVAGLLAVLAAALLWPGAGLYCRWERVRRLSERVLVEDALKHLNQCQSRQLPASLESLAGALSISSNEAAALAERLEKLGLVRPMGPGWQLTAEGRRDALRVVRIHRLWEKYLAEYTGVEEREWHELADQREHFVSSEEAEALAAEMGHPRYDPHGAPIPTACGDLPAACGVPLAELAEGEPAILTRIEDEPAVVYAQLIAQGLHVGARVRVLEKSGTKLRLDVDGEEQVLAHVVAASALATPLAEPLPAAAEPCAKLSELAVGQQGKVVSISTACRGLQRRRLLDLGLLPGTVVAAELQSARGDTTAYRIRGALVALRQAQAEQIQIIPVNSQA